MTAQERIKKVANWLIYQDIAHNEKELSEMTGYTKSSFSQIMNGKVPLSDKFIHKLCQLDKNINEVWVKMGEGNMLKVDHNSIVQNGATCEASITGDITMGENAILQQQVETLEKLLSEKDKQLEEKERTIKILLERK